MMKSPSSDHSPIRHLPCRSPVRFGPRSPSQHKTMKTAPASPTKVPDTAPKAVQPSAQVQQTQRNFNQYQELAPALSP
jgi:hypothetical protein